MNLKSKKIGVIIAAIVGGTIIAGGSCVGCVACVAGMTSNSESETQTSEAANEINFESNSENSVMSVDTDKVYTVDDFCTLFNTEDDFASNHSNTVFKISATIVEKKDISYLSVNFDSRVKSVKWENEFRLTCKFKDRDDIKDLKEGDKITVSGKLFTFATTGIVLNDCELLSVDTDIIESLETEEQTTSAENETYESEIPPRDTATGKSDKSVDGLITIKATSVRNDKTGNWRYSAFSESGLDISEYALSYYNEYFESDNEIHAVVNFADKTTTRISYTSEMLFVTVLEYVDGEEHDAALLFSGDVIGDYIVYTDNGDIEALDTPVPAESESVLPEEASEVTPPATTTAAVTTTTAPPATEPAQSNEITLVSMTNPLRRNEDATITIQGAPNTEYQIAVYYSSGKSTAEGLENKYSDSNGIVSWTWHVGGKTNLGDNKRIKITGGGKTYETTFSVVD